MSDNDKKIINFDDSMFEDNDLDKDKESNKKISFDFDDDFDDELMLSIKPKISSDALRLFDEDDEAADFFIEQRKTDEPKKVEEFNVNEVKPIKQEQVKEKNEQYIEINNPFANKYTLSKNEYETNELYQEINVEKIKSIIESALYVVGQTGVSIGDLRRMTNASSSTIKKILKDWSNELEKDESRGILIKQFGDYYKFYSKPSNKEDLNKLITIKYKNPLSTKVMEVLAIIAYNQPCTKTIIEEIRLKDPTSTIQKLIDLGLVIDAGRASTPGCPILYTVTPKFYDIFGIKSLLELPKIAVDQPYFDENTSFFDTTRFED